jgi:3-phosphoglycerate kinase
VLVRTDFNVPLDEHGAVTDTTRIVAALPTIQYLIQNGTRIILVSHLGRPKGERNPKYSLKPVAKALEALLGQPVLFCDDCLGEDVRKVTKNLHDGEIVLLENVRFYKGETDNDPAFARELASCAEAYVNDAFGTAHRAHASTVGVTAHLSPCVAGFLIEKEITYLGDKISHPQRPLTVILGGAKVSDKISVIDALLEKADCMLIGGAMAYTFSIALGHQIGNSLVERDKLDIASQALTKARQKNVDMLLPIDHVVSSTIDFSSRSIGELKIVKEGEIPSGYSGVDIGPKTVELFSQQIANSKTVLWNGPMGIFEIPDCDQGTFAIAKAIAESSAISIVGGGDSISAIQKNGYASKISFMSTGGGASLEYLEGKILSGIAALDA